jgi:hypothetical protein
VRAGDGAWSSGSLRAVIGSGSSSTNKNPAEALGLAGWWLRCGSGLLVPCATSIPPSKKNDEPKNREYEEHAEQSGGRRMHARAGGAHAALL